ncbi:MAG: efflux RND transporter periplasmic adaptor subunit [Flavobacteriales bacterium]|nr:efflux RND transporter periplasmic adaptor subunit [Flavobacteriales bacterium]
MSVRILPLLMLSALLFAACEERNTGGQRHAPVPPDSVLAPLLRSTDEYTLSKLPTVQLRHGTETISLNLEGLLAWDTRAVGSITARVSGRIQKLHVRSMFARVTKGQAIAEIYSPELATAQENLLFILKQDPGNSSLIAAARSKLLLLGMTEGQLKRITDQGTIDPTVTIVSAYSGRAIDPGMEIPGPTTSTSGLQPTAALALKEGDYVAKGATLMSIADDRKIWALIKIPPAQSDVLASGDSITIVTPAGSGHSVRARIGSIEPFFREGEWNLTARVPLDNSTLGLPVGMPVHAIAKRKVKDADWLPRPAVVSLGTEQVVFVAADAGFTARSVQVGVRSDSLVQVLGGIKPAERVAANGQFLMDSESFIQTTP